jgi:hypothetical protein
MNKDGLVIELSRLAALALMYNMQEIFHILSTIASILMLGEDEALLFLLKQYQIKQDMGDNGIANYYHARFSLN